LREREPLRLAIDDMQAERREEPKDASGLAHAREIVIAGGDDDHGLGERLREPRELREGVQDRRVRRTHRVEDIAGDDDDLRRDRNHPRHELLK
jgi:hypothetical protein